MKRIFFRFLCAQIGAFVAALLVASMEIRAAHQVDNVPFFVLWRASVGILIPLASAIGATAFSGHLFLDPKLHTPSEWVGALRAKPFLLRLRLSALAWLAPPFLVLFLCGEALFARFFFQEGDSRATGYALSLTTFCFAFVLIGVLFSLSPYIRKWLLKWSEFRRSSHVELQPHRSFFWSSLCSISIVAFGIYFGDANGDGFWPFGIFGVLKREALDLSPIFYTGLIFLFSIVSSVILRPFFSSTIWFIFFPIAFSFAGLQSISTALWIDPGVAVSLSRHAPLTSFALQILSKVTDRDHDGVSRWYGGGDCNDHRKDIGPHAVEIANNGIDEDCSGSDLIFVPNQKMSPSPSNEKLSFEIHEEYNLVLITIDSLRADVVTAKNLSKEITPNLNKLASRSVVFDRAYAMASYTGKSLGPLMAGTYPSETPRDGTHFTRYLDYVTMFAERLKSRNIRTFGASSLAYLSVQSGLVQGFDLWDLSAKPPPGEGDKDNSVTSEKISDAALKLMQDPSNTGGRFFMWLHYMDPHAQYIFHKEAPDFSENTSTMTEKRRAAYDGEVWYVDSHVGRVLNYIHSQKWKDRTMVVVTSDHGEAFNDHGMNFHGFEIWESLQRVPLIIYVPALTEKSPHHVPVKRSHIDLIPTLLELMKVKIDENGSVESKVDKYNRLSGESLLADLDPARRLDNHFIEKDVYIDMPVGPYNSMRRALIHGPTPGMKLIHLGGSKYQLFDLGNDPAEKIDLAKDKIRLDPMIQLMDNKRATLREIQVKPVELP